MTEQTKTHEELMKAVNRLMDANPKLAENVMRGVATSFVEAHTPQSQVLFELAEIMTTCDDTFKGDNLKAAGFIVSAILAETIEVMHTLHGDRGVRKTIQYISYALHEKAQKYPNANVVVCEETIDTDGMTEH